MIPPGETPAPQAPDDPTRTREAIERRIEALLTRDYRGDTETRDLCHMAARRARRYYFGEEGANDWLRIAERAAELSHDRWNLSWTQGGE